MYSYPLYWELYSHTSIVDNSRNILPRFWLSPQVTQMLIITYPMYILYVFSDSCPSVSCPSNCQYGYDRTPKSNGCPDCKCGEWNKQFLKNVPAWYSSSFLELLVKNIVVFEWSDVELVRGLQTVFYVTFKKPFSYKWLIMFSLYNSHMFYSNMPVNLSARIWLYT